MPESYPQARFCLWLKKNGIYEQVCAAVEAEGRDFRRELNDMYVSPLIAKGLLAADPNFAGNEKDARAALRAGRVGFVFQSFQLLPGMTALENVALPLQIGRNSGARAQAEALLHEVGLGERLSHQPRQLSGGEQQRVALARAFAGDPQVLFADEPTGNLDAESGRRIIDLLFGLRDRVGSTLLLVTHDQELARRCDRILRISAGRLQEAA